MSRYIDADKLIDDIRPFAEYDSNRSNKDWARRFEIAIDAQPTADVVEVVRCEDCIYEEECGREVLVNEYDNDKAVDITGFLFYCSHGERADT